MIDPSSQAWMRVPYSPRGYVANGYLVAITGYILAAVCVWSMVFRVPDEPPRIDKPLILRAGETLDSKAGLLPPRERSPPAMATPL